MWGHWDEASKQKKTCVNGFGKEVIKFMTGSILESASVQVILEIAKKNLERDGDLHPVLFLRLASGERAVLPINLSGCSDERKAAVAQVGRVLRSQGKIVEEALFLSVGWFVKVSEPALDLKVPPSQHPNRRESILIVGRDATRTRTTSLIQSFSRDGNGKPRWQEIEMAEYNVPVEAGSGPLGLIDYLFINASVN